MKGGAVVISVPVYPRPVDQAREGGCNDPSVSAVGGCFIPAHPVRVIPRGKTVAGEIGAAWQGRLSFGGA